MGTFFLFAGTVLFLAGLGCLLAVFSSIIAKLKMYRNTSAYFRKRSNYRNGILTALGIALVIASQGMYWFHGEVSRFIPFEDSVPQVRIDFLYEQFRTPRMILTATDQNSQIASQIIPFNSDHVQVAAEVIEWKKLFSILGLKDCYLVTGVYFHHYQDPDSSDLGLPDYPLNGGPSGLASLISTLSPVFPAEARFFLSPAIDADPQFEHVIEVLPDSINYQTTFDFAPTADYSY